MTFILPFSVSQLYGKYPTCHHSGDGAIKSAPLDGKPNLRCLRIEPPPKKIPTQHALAPDRDCCQSVSHAASRHQSSDPSEVRSGLQQRLCNSIRWSQTLEANKTILVGQPFHRAPPLTHPPLLFHSPLHWQQGNRLDHAYTTKTQLPLA